MQLTSRLIEAWSVRQQHLSSSFVSKTKHFVILLVLCLSYLFGFFQLESQNDMGKKNVCFRLLDQKCPKLRYEYAGAGPLQTLWLNCSLSLSPSGAEAGFLTSINVSLQIIVCDTEEEILIYTTSHPDEYSLGTLPISA